MKSPDTSCAVLRSHIFRLIGVAVVPGPSEREEDDNMYQYLDPQFHLLSRNQERKATSSVSLPKMFAREATQLTESASSMQPRVCDGLEELRDSASGAPAP